MSVIVKSGVPGKVPSATNLEYGQLALNYADQKIYFKNSSNVVTQYGLSRSGDTMTGTLNVGSGGSVLVTGSGGLGYGVGSGGTVTQATSKATTVTLNKPSGRITTNNSLLAANSTVSFQLTNSVVAAADTLLLGVTSSVNPDAYLIRARCFAGGAVISIVNQTGTGLSDVIDIQFQVIKGATS